MAGVQAPIVLPEGILQILDEQSAGFWHVPAESLHIPTLFPDRISQNPGAHSDCVVHGKPIGSGPVCCAPGRPGIFNFKFISSGLIV